MNDSIVTDRFLPGYAEALATHLRSELPDWNVKVIISTSKKARIEAVSADGNYAFNVMEYVYRTSKMRIRTSGHYGDLLRYISDKDKTAPSISFGSVELNNPSKVAHEIVAFLPKLIKFFDILLDRQAQAEQTAQGRYAIASILKEMSGGAIRSLHSGLYPDLYLNTGAVYMTGEVQSKDRVRMDVTMPAELAFTIAELLGSYSKSRTGADDDRKAE